MGHPQPMIPDDELQGALRKAVEQVLQDPVSEDLVERCAARAAEISGSEPAGRWRADLGWENATEAPNSWRWPAAACLAASLLVALALNALQIVLQQPDPHRRQAAQLKTPDQKNYCIYSDLRLERVFSN